MKHNHTVIWGVLLLITSCAAIEPTRIENSIYINPEYQFSLRIPADWEASENIPEALKKSRSFLSNQKFKVVFYDLDNKSFILVAAEKTNVEWVSFKMYSDKFIESLDEFFAKEKNKFLKKADCHYYHYKIYNSNIENCAGNCLATKIEFQFQDLKATGHNIIYKSNYGILYTVSLILVVRESKHATQLDVFKTVIDSFNCL